MKLWNLNYDPIVDHFFLHKIGTLSSNSLDIMLLTARESIQMSYSSTRLTHQACRNPLKKGGWMEHLGFPASSKKACFEVFFLHFYMPGCMI